MDWREMRRIEHENEKLIWEFDCEKETLRYCATMMDAHLMNIIYEIKKDIIKRGFLNCGVSQGVPGFSNADASGKWTGLDVDFCRAIAAAILGDANKVKFIPTSNRDRFENLKNKEKEEKMRFETQPHFPNLAPIMPNFGTDRKTYVHPDTRYTFENADNAPGLGDDKTNIFLPHAVRRFPNALDERGYGLLNTSEQFPKYLEDRILKAHREGKYPTRAERERAKQKLIPQELADPNTAHGAAQRTIRELYDPAKEGINTDVIPPDVLRRNDPVEIRYYAQKAKIMQGR